MSINIIEVVSLYLHRFKKKSKEMTPQTSMAIKIFKLTLVCRPIDNRKLHFGEETLILLVNKLIQMPMRV